MSIIKDSKLQIILNLYKLISEVSMAQLANLKKFFDTPNDKELLEETENNEMIIDRLELKMREEIAYTILMFAPMAEDLRRIISYQDMATNLERTGDLVLNCVHNVIRIDFTRNTAKEYYGEIMLMLEDVTTMIGNAIDSFTTKKGDVAKHVIAFDDTIDEQMRNLIVHLSENYAHKELSPTEVRELLRLQSVVHNLERCGDMATNIAESTVYLVDGQTALHADEQL